MCGGVAEGSNTGATHSILCSCHADHRRQLRGGMESHRIRDMIAPMVQSTPSVRNTRETTQTLPLTILLSRCVFENIQLQCSERNILSV